MEKSRRKAGVHYKNRVREFYMLFGDEFFQENKEKTGKEECHMQET